MPAAEKTRISQAMFTPTVELFSRSVLDAEVGTWPRQLWREGWEKQCVTLFPVLAECEWNGASGQD